MKDQIRALSYSHLERCGVCQYVRTHCYTNRPRARRTRSRVVLCNNVLKSIGRVPSTEACTRYVRSTRVRGRSRSSALISSPPSVCEPMCIKRRGKRVRGNHERVGVPTVKWRTDGKPHARNQPSVQVFHDSLEATVQPSHPCPLESFVHPLTSTLFLFSVSQSFCESLHLFLPHSLYLWIFQSQSFPHFSYIPFVCPQLNSFYFLQLLKNGRISSLKLRPLALLEPLGRPSHHLTIHPTSLRARQAPGANVIIFLTHSSDWVLDLTVREAVVRRLAILAEVLVL